MEPVLSADLYKSLLRDIEAEFEVRRKDLESNHRKAIEALNEAWPKMGGSKNDLESLEVETTTSTSVERSPATERAEDQPQAVEPERNGAPSGRTIHMTVIGEEVDNAISDGNADEITQTDLKERILKKYPDAKVASLAASISRRLSQLTEQGRLELVEKGTASRPHKYRVKRNPPERNLLGP